LLIDRNTIQQAKESLGDRNADIIQELLQMEKYDTHRRVGCCPDPDHIDDTPSCSYNPKTYAFHCFGCGKTFDILDAYMIAKQCTFNEACEMLFDAAGVKYDFAELCAKQHGYKYPTPETREDKNEVYNYLQLRKISKKTVDYLGIGEDSRGNCVFNYYDLNDCLKMVKYRPSHKVKKGDNKTWCQPGADTSFVLFNMNKINTSQPLIIATGEIDCASLIESGFTNSVSVPLGDGNTQWIAECWDWLQQFDEIILAHDNDDSGYKFAKDVSTRLGEYRVKVLNVPKVWEEEDGTKIEINDLNELLFYGGTDAIKEAVNHSQDSEIPSVIDYSDVKKFDMSDVDGFVTNLSDMDDALNKFYMGSVTILTGTAGSGKSSLISTLICQSADQGYPVFVYSGELSNPSLKNWVDCVHAGRRGMNEYPKRVGNGSYYRVNNESYNRINKTYKGRIFFYKDSFDQKVSNIMATAESVIRKNDVKTLIFDNMTSIDLENNDDNKWQKQDEFVREIISFATKWNVCCIVVLHPKKMDMNRRMSLYDLQGVSSSVNLSHRVLALYRVPEKEKEGKKKKNGDYYEEPIPYDVTIEVLKDRFGSGGGKTIGLYYDVPSRRFYDSMETLDHQYEWDKDSDYSGIPLPFPDAPPSIFGQDEREVLGEHQLH
jgi:KaiC/GvpD/RAD55 family RecA-like ATPase